MPKTKTAQIKAEAKENTIESPVKYSSHVDMTNYEYIQSLEYDDLVMCLEYIFLLREIHGLTGFIRTIKGFKEKLPDCWDEIKKSNLLKWFNGKSSGFMSKWLTERLYNKLKNADIEQMASWLTYFDKSSSYRTQMLKGENHQLLAIKADQVIKEWLNEV